MSGKGLFLKMGMEPNGDGSFIAQGQLQGLSGIDGPIGKGDVYYLIPNGSTASGLRGKKWTTAFGTLEEAEAAMTANQNDLLKIASGSSMGKIAASITWDKAYTHVIGLSAPVHTNMRTRFENGAIFDPLVNVSATGCSFTNLYFFQGGTTTVALTCIDVTGSRNFFHNVHFGGPGHTTPAANSGACALYLNGGEENRFLDCTFGLDTIKRTAIGGILKVDAYATRNLFEHCRFVSYAEMNTIPMVITVDAASMDSYMEFDDCLFYENVHNNYFVFCFHVASKQSHPNLSFLFCQIVFQTLQN